MRYINFFPQDSRSSKEKTRIIEGKTGAKRIAKMKTVDFMEYGESYWDSSSKFKIGYGGYVYDGRYKETARKIIDFYNLKPGDKIFEVGCGKGFLLVEFKKFGMEVAGIDVSKYAVANGHPMLKGSLIRDDFSKLKIASKTYNFVLAKDCLPHFREKDIKSVLHKYMDISKRFIYFDIEVCRSQYECNMMYKWDITHNIRKSPDWWKSVFKEIGFNGDYHFKILVEDVNLPKLSQN